MSALEAALAAPMPVRTPEGSRQRARSEQDQVGGPVATKARTLAPPNVILTPARDVAALRDFVNPPGETLEELRVCQGVTLFIADLATDCRPLVPSNVVSATLHS